jgi:hypothetical protein
MQVYNFACDHLKPTTCKTGRIFRGGYLETVASNNIFLQAAVSMGPVARNNAVEPEREMVLIISYNQFWWLTSITNHVD